LVAHSVSKSEQSHQSESDKTQESHTFDPSQGTKNENLEESYSDKINKIASAFSQPTIQENELPEFLIKEVNFPIVLMPVYR